MTHAGSTGRRDVLATLERKINTTSVSLWMHFAMKCQQQQQQIFKRSNIKVMIHSKGFLRLDERELRGCGREIWKMENVSKLGGNTNKGTYTMPSAYKTLKRV